MADEEGRQEKSLEVRVTELENALKGLTGGAEGAAFPCQIYHPCYPCHPCFPPPCRPPCYPCYPPSCRPCYPCGPCAECSCGPCIQQQ
jgi:hypothetical protein